MSCLEQYIMSHMYKNREKEDLEVVQQKNNSAAIQLKDNREQSLVQRALNKKESPIQRSSKGETMPGIASGEGGGDDRPPRKNPLLDRVKFSGGSGASKAAIVASGAKKYAMQTAVRLLAEKGYAKGEAGELARTAVTTMIQERGAEYTAEEKNAAQHIIDITAYIEENY